MHFKNSAWPMLCAVLFGAGALLAPRPAQAFCTLVYGQLVGACMLQTSQVANNFKWIASMGTNIDKYYNWYDQVAQNKARLEQMDIGGLSFNGMMGSVRVNVAELKERGLDDGADKYCKKGRSSVAQEQYDFCLRRNRLENQRYNATVKMIQDLKRNDDKLQELFEKRRKLDPATSAGKLASLDNEVAQVRANMKADIQSNMAALGLYDSGVAVLNNEIRLSAQKGLSNKGGLLGTVAQGGILKLGLKEARKRRNL